MKNWWLALYDDVMDRGALARHGRVELPDVWKVCALVASTAVSVSTTVAQLANGVLGLPGSFVPVALTAIAVVWAWHVARAKADRPSATIVPASDTETYVFHRPVRWAAKAALPLLALLAAQQTLRLADDLVPLPPTIYGYLVDGRSGSPAEGVSVRVVDASGVDVTGAALPSDSTGLYVVHTSRRVRRSATARAAGPGCADEAPLPLYRVFETTVDARGADASVAVTPLFRHTLLCAGKTDDDQTRR